MAEPKQRHGCLAALLIVMIIFNAGTTLMYVAASAAIREQLPDDAGWALGVLPILGLANTVFAVALWYWKKWAFWGFVVSGLAALVVNLKIGVNPAQALLGLVGIVLLYVTLQIGNDQNKGWPQLE